MKTNKCQIERPLEEVTPNEITESLQGGNSTGLSKNLPRMVNKPSSQGSSEGVTYRKVLRSQMEGFFLRNNESSCSRPDRRRKGHDGSIISFPPPLIRTKVHLTRRRNRIRNLQGRKPKKKNLPWRHCDYKELDPTWRLVTTHLGSVRPR